MSLLAHELIPNEETYSKEILKCHYCLEKCGNNICGRCKFVTYCDKRCQVSDWLYHKFGCKNLSTGKIKAAKYVPVFFNDDTTPYMSIEGVNHNDVSALDFSKYIALDNGSKYIMPNFPINKYHYGIALEPQMNMTMLFLNTITNKYRMPNSMLQKHESVSAMLAHVTPSGLVYNDVFVRTEPGRGSFFLSYKREVPYHIKFNVPVAVYKSTRFGLTEDDVYKIKPIIKQNDHVNMEPDIAYYTDKKDSICTIDVGICCAVFMNVYRSMDDEPLMCFLVVLYPDAIVPLEYKQLNDIEQEHFNLINSFPMVREPRVRFS